MSVIGKQKKTCCNIFKNHMFARLAAFHFRAYGPDEMVSAEQFCRENDGQFVRIPSVIGDEMRTCEKVEHHAREQ